MGDGTNVFDIYNFKKAQQNKQKQKEEKQAIRETRAKEKAEKERKAQVEKEQQEKAVKEAQQKQNETPQNSEENTNGTSSDETKNGRNNEKEEDKTPEEKQNVRNDEPENDKSKNDGEADKPLKETDDIKDPVKNKPTDKVSNDENENKNADDRLNSPKSEDSFLPNNFTHNAPPPPRGNETNRPTTAEMGSQWENPNDDWIHPKDYHQSQVSNVQPMDKNKSGAKMETTESQTEPIPEEVLFPPAANLVNTQTQYQPQQPQQLSPMMMPQQSQPTMTPQQPRIIYQPSEYPFPVAKSEPLIIRRLIDQSLQTERTSSTNSNDIENDIEDYTIPLIASPQPRENQNDLPFHPKKSPRSYVPPAPIEDVELQEDEAVANLKEIAQKKRKQAQQIKPVPTAPPPQKPSPVVPQPQQVKPLPKEEAKTQLPVKESRKSVPPAKDLQKPNQAPEPKSTPPPQPSPEPTPSPQQSPEPEPTIEENSNEVLDELDKIENEIPDDPREPTPPVTVTSPEPPKEEKQPKKTRSKSKSPALNRTKSQNQGSRDSNKNATNKNQPEKSKEKKVTSDNRVWKTWTKKPGYFQDPNSLLDV